MISFPFGFLILLFVENVVVGLEIVNNDSNKRKNPKYIFLTKAKVLVILIFCLRLTIRLNTVKKMKK